MNNLLAFKDIIQYLKNNSTYVIVFISALVLMALAVAAMYFLKRYRTKRLGAAIDKFLDQLPDDGYAAEDEAVSAQPQTLEAEENTEDDTQKQAEENTEVQNTEEVFEQETAENTTAEPTKSTAPEQSDESEDFAALRNEELEFVHENLLTAEDLKGLEREKETIFAEESSGAPVLFGSTFNRKGVPTPSADKAHTQQGESETAPDTLEQEPASEEIPPAPTPKKKATADDYIDKTGYWRITDVNKEVFTAKLYTASGKLLLSGNECDDRASAMQNITDIRNHLHDENFSMKDTKTKYFFKIVGANKRVLAVSEKFGSELIRKAKLQSVKNIAPLDIRKK